LCDDFDGGGEVMKKIFEIVLFTILPLASSVAQDAPADTAKALGCGTQNTKFEVKTGKADHPSQPVAGKALVYFIEDDSNFGSFPKPTTRIALDGQWAGATHGNSYFYVSVNPGVHHVCANWQFAVLLGKGRKTAVAHFTAEPGEVYYFEVANTYWLDHGTAAMSLNPLDGDEGQLLANTFSLSTFHEK
jgi:hypothetical protein